jgi:pimeloyl-ACP methyl ester carboxylesterase
VTVLLAATACAATLSPPAQAEIAWKPCGDSNDVACGHLTVPLDPSSALPGTITLAMRRHRSPVGESKDAVIALAGGPGQSAIPFLSDFGQILGPIASTRDVIAFDQRGTGLSDPLACAAFEHVRHNFSPRAVAICAGQIGATRDLFTTADTVADIEAIRRAGGYEKLVLYGTSYGTKVAERYAQEYPSHVEALVLDSVVPPSGPEPFDSTTFAAVSRVLHQLCSAKACTHITPEPVSDLARLVKLMGRRSLRARAIDETGKAQTTQISSNDLLGILMEGDFNPILRSEFPAATRSALQGDTAALGRLIARAQDGSEGEEPEELSEGFDLPLYYSTICDEAVFPWNRSASSPTRLHEALAALRSQPPGAFEPFTSANALALSDVPVCAAWPFTPGGPELDTAPLPNVPTLILSGAEDLRTPTANAKILAKEIPDASLLVVPNTGHSVLGSDPSSCAHDALLALFAGRPVKQCKGTTPPPLFSPTPLPPHDLAAVAPAHGNHGLPGRTVSAVVFTLEDCNRQLLLALLSRAGGENLRSSSARAGGLLAGWCGIGNGGEVFHGDSYVRGMTVSGRISKGLAKLRIGGSRAADGTITIAAHGGLEGVLAGHDVHLTHATTAKLEGGAGTLALASRLASLSHRPAKLAEVSITSVRCCG